MFLGQPVIALDANYERSNRHGVIVQASMRLYILVMVLRSASVSSGLRNGPRLVYVIDHVKNLETLLVSVILHIYLFTVIYK